MKNKFFCLVFICISFLGYSQKVFKTGMKFTFSQGNNCCNSIGSDCGYPVKDIDITYNDTEGYMLLDVNKTCHTWSFVQHWMGGTYASSIVFKNRYLELRIKSNEKHEDSLSVIFQASGGNPPIGKSIPKIDYTINKAETWEIKFFNVGGDADTIFKEIDYTFPNGKYEIDYIFYGDSAIPPIPTIENVKTQMMKFPGSLYSVNLTGISIPGRHLEGLTIEAQSTFGGDFFDTVYIENKNLVESQMKLYYSISPYSMKSSDSITIVLKDTIRGTSKNMKFMVYSGNQMTNIADVEDDVKVYPNVVDHSATVEFSSVNNADIQIIDLTGNVVSAFHILNKSSELLDLSGLAQGVYIAKISKGHQVFIRKIVKL